MLEAAVTYQEQAFKVLDKAKTEVRYNSEWLVSLFASRIHRARRQDDGGSHARARRLRQTVRRAPPDPHPRVLYPLLQGYDSVALEADIELGGTDQLFNLMVGRDLMPRYGQTAQMVLTMPLLEGTDARMEEGAWSAPKMSKSDDNYIGITEAPIVMFRKVMQIDDAVIWRYYDLLSSRSTEEIASLRADVERGKSPLEIKALFAREVIGRFHSAEAALAAQHEFESTYTKHGVPDQVAEIRVQTEGPTLWIAKALSLAGLVKTTSEGKRLVEQGGVEVDGQRIVDPQHQLASGGRYLVRAGSKNRRFANIIVEATT